MENKVACVKCLGNKGEKLMSLYGEQFVLKVEKVPGDMPYWTHMPDGGGVGAGVGQSPDGQDHVMFYVGADDPQTVLDKAEKLGGKTVMPVTEMEMVTFGLFTDPEGNTIGVVKNQQN